MLGFYDYTVILTYLGVVSSIIGMSFAVEQHYLYAVICLLVSGLCDMFDGAVARTKKNRTEMEKKNGIQLDSLADVVCFGAFPAVIGYCLGMECKYSLLFAVTGALYVLCAIIRLAYFNVTEEERQKSTDGKRKFYQGLPVTSAALIFPLPVLLQRFAGCIFPVCLCRCPCCDGSVFHYQLQNEEVRYEGKCCDAYCRCIVVCYFTCIKV